MPERLSYWPLSSTVPTNGAVLELRAALAWELLSHFALVAAREAGEDSAKRQKLETLSPAATVKRCFDLADAFVEGAQERQEIRPVTLQDEQFAWLRGGELARLRDQTQYPRRSREEIEDMLAQAGVEVKPAPGSEA